jgi:hypothetical protein
VGTPELDQPDVQRQGMIGRFSGLHSGLGVPDGLVEPAELGEHVGEPGPRECRLDGGGPDALVPQAALERDVPTEKGGRVAELAPCGVYPAQLDSCDHLDRA